MAGAGKNKNARDFVKKVGKKCYCRKTRRSGKKRFSPQPDKAMRIVGSGRDGNLP